MHDYPVQTLSFFSLNFLNLKAFSIVGVFTAGTVLQQGPENHFSVDPKKSYSYFDCSYSFLDTNDDDNDNNNMIVVVMIAIMIVVVKCKF